jgi:ATP-binding cassette subfamily B protein
MNNEPSTLNLMELAEILLDDNQALSFNMLGFSMYPALKPGDRGVVEKTELSKLKIGDIIVFKSNAKLVAHRLIRIEESGTEKVFIAKGDKNTHSDEPVEIQGIVGRITSFERNKKTVKGDSNRMKFRKFLALNFPKSTLRCYNFLFTVNNKMQNIRLKFQSLKSNIRLISENSGKIFFSNAVISVLQGVLPFIIIVCIKTLIDRLTHTDSIHSPQTLTFTFLLIFTALMFLISGMLSEVSSFYSEKLSQSVTRLIYGKLHEKHEMLDLSHYENPTQQDKMHRAVQEASFRPIKMLNELLTGIKSIASSLFLAGLFVSIRWYLMLILIVAIIPGILVRLKFSREHYKLKESQSTKEREMYYFNRILTGFPFAKELKLFGFARFFRVRFNKTQETLFEEKITLRKKELQLGLLAQLFAIVLIFFSLGFVSYLKMTGAITLGTVVLFFFAFQRGYSVLNDFFQSFTRILQDNTFLQDFIDFMKINDNQSFEKKDVLSFSLNQNIVFENVSFRYPSSKRNALKSVNLTIPAGKTVAFVGANGSGKTTMIKLLCGFYTPDKGKIKFDGNDSKSIGEQEIRKNITAVFQDFALYNIPAIENIGLGNTEIKLDKIKAKKAASQAGIDEILSKLPDGYETMLGNLFKGGEELSIGQWQKIAIARAFYRDSELILMDEPSSALDAESEMQIIESLKKLSERKTAVIVSHRLSTVQWADLIYLFDKGQVIESGTHDELMKLQKQYYNLFRTANRILD